MTRTLLIILFVAAGYYSTHAQERNEEQGPLSDLLFEENPEYNFRYRNTQELHSGDFLAHFFVYRSKKDKRTGGSGFEITTGNRKLPIWYKMIQGDFGPHSPGMIDMNMDNKPDLFYFAGFEDVFSTHIYLAAYDDAEESAYANNHFIPVYSNHNDYSVLIDPEGDNHPEILDSGYSGETHRSSLGCTGKSSGIIIDKNNRATLTDSVRKKIVSKYFEITAGFDDYNFDYSMPDVYPVFNSFIMSPIKIFRIEGKQAVDVTSTFPEYLNWRIRILKQIKESSSDKCHNSINRVITYLQSQLNE
jgi:hypothetical protein